MDVQLSLADIETIIMWGWLAHSESQLSYHENLLHLRLLEWQRQLQSQQR